MRSNATPALDSIAGQIVELEKRSVTGALRIGSLLLDAKEITADWQGWLNGRFSWSPRTAQRFMRACKWYDAQPDEKRQVVAFQFSLFALYTVSAKKTSPELRAAIFELAATHERVGERAVRKLRKARATPAVIAPTISAKLADMIEKAKALALALAAARVEDRREVLKIYRTTFRRARRK